MLAAPVIGGVEGFRLPIDPNIADGVHITTDPYQWRVVSHREGFDYKLREATGTLLNGPKFAELATRQHWIVDRGIPASVRREMQRSLQRDGIRFTWNPVRGGERLKTLLNVQRMAMCLNKRGICRRDLIVGLGGGAVLDFARLVAALYGKGQPLGLASSTGLAHVDAIAGVKTAVNIGTECKNLLGTYYQAELALLDLTLARTVNREFTAAGLMEILKMALIMGPDLWVPYAEHARTLLKSAFQCDEAIPITRLAIQGMVQRLQPNLKEWLLARDVDLGHLLVSIFELLAGWPHGIAVGLDLALMVTLSCVLGYMSKHDRDSVLESIRSVGVPLDHELLTPDLVVVAAEKTRRNRGGELNLPIPEAIGKVVVHPEVSDEALIEAVRVQKLLAA